MKVLLSFLGTSKYQKCSYYFENKENIVKGVKYIQEAMVELFLKKFENFKVYIFITDEAKKKNWDNKLEKILITKYGEEKIKPVKIPSINSEAEIWELFDIVYSSIPEKSEVIIDITHAFRSIPMLAVILINYAKILKNIKVNGIYYGAIEILGPFSEIEKIPEEKRIAPIINLTSFLKLMEWTEASFEFSRYGISKKLKDLTMAEVIPRLKKSKGKDENAKKLNFIANQLDNFTKCITTVRGKDLLFSINYSQIKSYLEDVKTTLKIKPLKPLVNIILDKIDNFNNNDILNFIPAVEFCIKHNLIQQAITILLEGVITYFCEKFQFDYIDISKRNLISQVMNIKTKNIPENKWEEPANKNIEITKQLLKKVDKEIANIFCKLQDMRNDINHAGFKPNSRKVETFEKKLKDFFEKIKEEISICEKS